MIRFDYKIKNFIISVNLLALFTFIQYNSTRERLIVYQLYNKKLFFGGYINGNFRNREAQHS